MSAEQGRTPRVSRECATPTGEVRGASLPGSAAPGRHAERGSVATRGRPHSRVAVVGGGISGLAAAQRLAELGVEVALLEARPRCGGVVRTECADGFLVEEGPDSWLARKPWAAALCGRAGLGEEIVPTYLSRRGSFVWCSGRLQPLPEGLTSLVPTRLGPLARTGLLSPAGKARLLLEPLAPRGPECEDESLAGFFRRRLGREASQRLVEPLVRGIYGGDPGTLSLRATFPQLADIERRHGSLILGLLRESHLPESRPARSARAGAVRAEAAAGGASWPRRSAPEKATGAAFLSLRRGMGSLVEALAGALPPGALRPGVAVEAIRRLQDGRLELLTRGGGAVTAGAALLAVPAPEAARLLAPLDPALGALLGGIHVGPSLTVSLGFERGRVRHPLDGYGFVVPETEDSPLLACTWASSKFPGRAPEGSVLLRAFLADPAALAELEDARVVDLAARALRPILGLKGAPRVALVHRWRDALPRYAVGHPTRVAEIERRAAALPGLFLAGASYHGVGVPDCIRSGEAAAGRAAVHVTRRPSAAGHTR